jgi:DNA-binding response OmpR family regulator
MVKTVLVIGEEKNLRETIIEVLKLERWDVFGAQDALLGIEQARHLLPDLILCDVHPPVIDGYDVLVELRRSSSTANIPVLFITASNISAIVREMEASTSGYLTKPFGAHDLLRRVRGYLAS